MLISWYSYACLPVSASARNGLEVPFSLPIASVRLVRAPELPLGLDCLQRMPALIEELRDHDEPCQQRHDQQNDEGRPRDYVAIRDQRAKAIWVFNGCLLTWTDSLYLGEFI